MRKSYQNESIQKTRLIAALTMRFQTASLVILRLDAEYTKIDEQQQLRLLLYRAQARGCENYVVARQFSRTGNVIAFYVFADIDEENAEKICERWTLGPHEIRQIDTRRPESLICDVITKNSIPYGKRLYKPRSPRATK